MMLDSELALVLLDISPYVMVTTVVSLWVSFVTYLFVATAVSVLKERRTWTLEKAAALIREACLGIKKMSYVKNVLRTSGIKFEESDGMYLFLVSCHSGCVQIALALMDWGVRPELVIDKHGYDALFIFLHHVYTVNPMVPNKYVLAELMLRAGCSPNRQGSNGKCAMHAAARGGDYEMLDLLLQYEGDPFIKTDDGRDIFAYARYTENDTFMRLLRWRILEDPAARSFNRTSGSVGSLDRTNGFIGSLGRTNVSIGSFLDNDPARSVYSAYDPPGSINRTSNEDV